jgi:hypothetical protein
MGMTTLLRFLLGGRQAIIDVATCRHALWVGGLFVLSAGFAREYNQEDLLHDPWYLVVPLAASLVTSLALFALLALAANFRSTTPLPFLPYYRAFLSLYWMTAPLAWLYALPVENYLSAADSVRVNLSLLGIVSLWRVLLITRCASVLLGSSYLSAFFLVMLFADTLALGALYFSPLPIIDFMGGISHTESESVIIDVALMVGFFGGASWLLWFIGSLFVLGSTNRSWSPLQLEDHSPRKVTYPLWALAFAALIVWGFVLPHSQPPQQLKRLVESDLLNGRIDAALRTMSAHERGEFPPHWDPPPWHGYGQDKPPILRVLQAVDEAETSEWVKDAFLKKFIRQIGGEMTIYYLWDRLDDEEFSGYLQIIRDNPETHDIIRRQRTVLLNVMDRQGEDQKARRKEIHDLLQELGMIIEAESQEAEIPNTTDDDSSNDR